MIVIHHIGHPPEGLASTLSHQIERHRTLARLNGLEEMTVLLVVEPCDDEMAVVAEIGFSPIINPITGEIFGTPEFEPYWAMLERRGDWFEMIHTIGNDGFAFILLIEDRLGKFPELLLMCRKACS